MRNNSVSLTIHDDKLKRESSKIEISKDYQKYWTCFKIKPRESHAKNINDKSIEKEIHIFFLQ